MSDKRLQKETKTIEAPDTEIRQAIKEVASTESGMLFLQWLMNHCGYKEPIMVMHPDTREIVQSASFHNESLRTVWLTVRKLVPKNKLNAIEAER